MALDANKQCYDAPCHLSLAVIVELEWWKNHLTTWNGKSLVLRQPDLQIESDASLIGWGAYARLHRWEAIGPSKRRHST